MDACKRFFSRLCFPVEKHVPLPPELSEKPETILKILHDHNLLVPNIWRPPHCTIKSIGYNAPAQTVFAFEQPLEASDYVKNVTLTRLDGGVSVLEEQQLGSITTGYQIHWTVTKAAKTSEQYCLKETFVCEGHELLDPLDFYYRFQDDYHPEHTKRLVHLLSQVATGEVSISDMSEREVRPLDSSQQERVDTSKSKDD